jgi:succinoglycan biosynthesis protein ExoA
MTDSPENLPLGKLPRVTVVMPVRNEADFIERSLGAVLAQDYPADKIEVIVADGMSTDTTRDIVRSFGEDHPALHLIDNPGKIVPIGLNAAIRQAKGWIIIRIDGHCEVAPTYIRKCVEHLLKDGVDAVGGPIETIGENATSKAIAIGMSSNFGVGGSAFRTIRDREASVDTVAFPAYPRRTIEKCGSFDEELVRNQDDEYNYRLRKLGGKILLSPDIKSKYYSRSSLKGLWRQYFQYGYWKVRVLQKHPRQMRPRQFAPPTFVAALLGSALLAVFLKFGLLFFLAISGSYILANLLASVATASRKGRIYLLLLPLVFAILHLSYGTGFLIGLIRFANRWREVARSR